jgi:hypothetical protein
MDAATLSDRIYAGYAKAAIRIGYLVDQYRPADAGAAIAPGNKLASFHASFNPMDMKYGRADKYGTATWFGLFDGRLTAVGDYLINQQDGTYFIAAQSTILPILCIECNRIGTFLRPQQQAGVGALPYGGNTDDTEIALMAAWPCSILQGTKGERGGINLPGDVRDPWWVILVPFLAGAVLRSGDIVKDDLERRYIISSAELTDKGWRLTATQAQT